MLDLIFQIMFFSFILEEFVGQLLALTRLFK